MFSACKKKEMTLDDLKKREPKCEGLDGLSYYHCGGMEGSTHHIELKTEKDGRITLTYQDADDPGMYDRYRIYEVDNDKIFEELDQMVREYNMSLWDEFPESEYEVLDAPGTSVTLHFVPQNGKKYGASVIRKFVRVSLTLPPFSPTFNFDGRAKNKSPHSACVSSCPRT